MNRHFNKGFTLIELIIVIAILAIFSSLIVPQIIGYVSVSSETVCRSNRQTLIREILANHTENPSITLSDSIDEVMASHGAVKTGALTYSKICPKSDAAIYTVILTSDGSQISAIKCSEHLEANTVMYITPIEATLKTADSKTVSGKYNSNQNLDAAFLKENNGIRPTLSKTDAVYTELFGTDYSSTWRYLPSQLEWHAKYATINGKSQAILYAQAANDLNQWAAYAIYCNGTYYVSLGRHPYKNQRTSSSTLNFQGLSDNTWGEISVTD